MVRQWIRENWGETIFVTDADIIYFRPFLDQLRQDLGDAKIAFACRGVDEGYNIGQMGLRCDKEVLEFFERVADGLGLEDRPERLKGRGRLLVEKAMVAWLVRTKTGVFNEWVAKRIEMGHPSPVSRAVKMVEISPNLKKRALEAVK